MLVVECSYGIRLPKTTGGSGEGSLTMLTFKITVLLTFRTVSKAHKLAAVVLNFSLIKEKA